MLNRWCYNQVQKLVLQWYLVFWLFDLIAVGNDAGGGDDEVDTDELAVGQLLSSMLINLFFFVASKRHNSLMFASDAGIHQS
jgi:hypothetical protein